MSYSQNYTQSHKYKLLHTPTHLHVDHNGQSSCSHKLEGLVIQFKASPWVNIVKEYAKQDKEDGNGSQDPFHQCEKEYEVVELCILLP